MGNAKIRKLVTQEAKWTDKSCKRHKHSFTIHALVIIERPEGCLGYYNVMCCERCSSFRSISEPGNVLGCILNPADIDNTLPKIYFHSPHRWIMGFKDINLIYDRR